jgi:tetratricopeptide (TPR) repeat protein
VLLDMHAFRQAQTAMSTFWLLRGGAWIAYETPVLGSPWSIPLEFPLFQWTVAGMVRLLSLPLDQAGRLTSLLYFYLTLPFAYFVLGRLEVRRGHRLVFLGLLLVSPQYLFWSRTFMIESAAVCLGVSYLAMTLALLGRLTPARAGLAALAGGLAGMVKLQTYVGFLLAAGLLVWRAWRHARLTVGQVVAVGIASFGVPLVLALMWTRFADSCRAANPLASQFLLSSQVMQSMMQYNVDGLMKHWDPSYWAVFVQRTVCDAIGHWAVGVLALAGLAVSVRRWQPAAACGSLFLAVSLIFWELHYIHNYYPYANALFLVAAVGFAAVSLLECPDWRRFAGLALVVATGMAEVSTYIRGYYVVQRQPEYQLSLPSYLKQVTDPADVLVIYGSTWNPATPYYAQRRALMRAEFPLSDTALRAAAENLKAYHVGAGIFCGDAAAQPDLLREGQLLFQVPPSLSATVDGCAVYLARESGATEADLETATMRAGLDALYDRGDAAQAAAHFRRVLERNPNHYGANFQLAKALDVAGATDDARAQWAKVLQMAEAVQDQPSIDTARARLAQRP